MAFDENVYELRRQKLKQIEALGQTAYRSRYDFTHTIPQILADYSDRAAEQLEAPRVTVRVAGRIMAIRLMGKAGFSHLQQSGKRLQIYVKKDAVGDKGFRQQCDPEAARDQVQLRGQVIDLEAGAARETLFGETPVDQLAGAPVGVQIDKNLHDGTGETFIHREAFARPVAGGAEPLELVDDDAAAFSLPLPDPF